MTLLPSSGQPDTALQDLQTRISELENQYAEHFLDKRDPEGLKKIHLRLEDLKQELKQRARNQP